MTDQFVKTRTEFDKFQKMLNNNLTIYNNSITTNS